MNQSEATKPKIAITMGDPAGVGPEIIAKVNWENIFHKAIPIIYGNRNIIEKAFTNYSNNSFKIIENNNFEKLSDHALYFIETDSFDISDLDFGKASKKSGEASLKAIQFATDACIDGLASAMITAPVSKEAIEMTGIYFHGHTEWISNRCGDFDEMMMMSSDKLNVGYVTTHLPLKELSETIDQNLVFNRIQTLHNFLTDSKQNTKIAVCGLNPHAGENGVIGNEEIQSIIPAIKKAQSEGIDCKGPFPADTLFIESQRKQYGAILAMYHDQGGIPFKMLAFDHGVNHTLGLPIIRTSVDHGTAWDIAWKGKASASSLEAAIDMAITLSEAKNMGLRNPNR